MLGRVYEYFLSQFASAEGKKGGEFYTPRCIVKLLVEMLEPFSGRVYDPCCGSSGMFVQSVDNANPQNGRWLSIDFTFRPPLAVGGEGAGSPSCPNPQQRVHGLADGNRVQPAQPNRNADGPLEERHRPQTQIPQLLQADHGGSTRPKSPQHK